ncbi:Neuroblastoma-amplified sequence [Trichinella pseudospiralis]|uniref:Neuroblastoma-amplified sequence n=1 Tax=Trichinella pseudospiralis TaxID=6337 RepID=A0A0V1HDU7_TRIPS|nr:Neuroblastoma-amplified sequence [Trichinella pseudospiralis]
MEEVRVRICHLRNNYSHSLHKCVFLSTNVSHSEESGRSTDDEENQHSCAELFALSVLSERTLADTDVDNEKNRSCLTGFLRKFCPVESIYRHLEWQISKECDCKVAVTSDESYIALLFAGRLEIRNIKNKEKCYRCIAFKDTFPKWCKLLWNSWNDMLLMTRSSPEIDVCNAAAYHCFSIKIEEYDIRHFNPQNAISSMVCRKVYNEANWSDVLYVLQYKGILHCYHIGRQNGYERMFCTDLSACAMSPFTFISMIQDMDCPAFITGSAFNRDKILSGVGIGLHIWREIDGEPYLVPFEVEDNKNKEMAAKSSLLSNLWKKRGFIVDVSFCEEKSIMVCLTSFSDIVVCHTFSLKVINVFLAETMLTPEAQAANIFRPVSVAWINSQDILILFSDGCLVVQEHSCNFKDPIWKKILYRFDYDCYKVASRSESVCFLEVARSDNANDSSFVMTSLKSTFNFSLYYLKWLIYSFIGEAYNEKKYPSSLVIETILWKIRTISPSYLVYSKLMEGDVLGAAAVADRAKQPLESFYKQFWQESHFDMDAIEQFLAPVGDKLWCLRQCAEQVPDSAEDYCHLLIHGMNVGARLLESGEFEEVIIVDLLHKIVRYWHILQTLLESRNASVHEFVSDSFLEFQQTMLLLRDKDPIWLAVHFAKHTFYSGLKILFLRHGNFIYRYWLLIISSIPEYEDVELIRQFLPTSDHCHTRPVMQSRVLPVKEIENLNFSDDILFANCVDRQLLEYFNSKLKESFHFCLDSELPDRSMLVDWYEWRSKEIEMKTHLPELAENILIFAIEKGGFKELTFLRSVFRMIGWLNYELFAEHRFSLKTLSKVPVVELVENIMKLSEKKGNTVDLVEEVMMPFCKCRAVELKISSEEYLQTLILLCAEKSLHFLDNLFRFARHNLHLLLPKSLVSVATLLDEAFCKTDGIFDHKSAASIMRTVGQAFGNDCCYPENLNLIQNTTLCFKALAKFGIGLSYTTVKKAQLDRTTAEGLLRNWIPKAVQHELLGKQANYNLSVEILDFFIGVIEDTNLCLTPDFTVKLFVSCLLNSKSEKLIKMVPSFFATQSSVLAHEQQHGTCSQTSTTFDHVDAFYGHMRKLDYNDAHQLVLYAMQQYVNSFTYSSFQPLQCALLCYDIFRNNPSDELLYQKTAIDILRLLNDIDVQLPPQRLQFFRSNNGSVTDFINEIFQLSSTAYKDSTKLFFLLKSVFANRLIENLSDTLLISCAVQAHTVQDYAICLFYCGKIADLDFSNGWEIAYKLLHDLLKSESNDFKLNTNILQSLMRILHFTYAHCNENFLDEVTSMCQQVADLLEEHQSVSGKKDSPPLPFTWSLNRFYGGSSEHLHNFTLPKEDNGQLDYDHPNFVPTLEAIYILLSLDQKDIVEQCIENFSPDKPMIDFMLYYYCLKFGMYYQIPIEKLINMSPLEVVQLLFSRLIREKSPFFEDVKCWLNQLSLGLTNPDKQSEEVDILEFFKDEEYRRKIVLGWARSKFYDFAMELGGKCMISQWEINMTHLEFLFVGSRLNSEELQNSISKWTPYLSLISHLQLFSYRMSVNVFPLIDGTDYNILMLYFGILKKTNLIANAVLKPTTKALQTADKHRIILKQLKYHHFFIDYKLLMSAKPGNLSCLLPCLTEANIVEIAKVLQIFPEKEISNNDLLVTWAMKCFLEHAKRVEAIQALQMSKNAICNLSPGSIATFAASILFLPICRKDLETASFVAKDFCEHLRAAFLHTQNEYVFPVEEYLFFYEHVNEFSVLSDSDFEALFEIMLLLASSKESFVDMVSSWFTDAVHMKIFHLSLLYEQCRSKIIRKSALNVLEKEHQRCVYACELFRLNNAERIFRKCRKASSGRSQLRDIKLIERYYEKFHSSDLSNVAALLDESASWDDELKSENDDEDECFDGGVEDDEHSADNLQHRGIDLLEKRKLDKELYEYLKLIIENCWKDVTFEQICMTDKEERDKFLVELLTKVDTISQADSFIDIFSNFRLHFHLAIRDTYYEELLLQFVGRVIDKWGSENEVDNLIANLTDEVLLNNKIWEHIFFHFKENGHLQKVAFYALKYGCKQHFMQAVSSAPVEYNWSDEVLSAIITQNYVPHIVDQPIWEALVSSVVQSQDNDVFEKVIKQLENAQLLAEAQYLHHAIDWTINIFVELTNDQFWKGRPAIVDTPNGLVELCALCIERQWWTGGIEADKQTDVKSKVKKDELHRINRKQLALAKKHRICKCCGFNVVSVTVRRSVWWHTAFVLLLLPTCHCLIWVMGIDLEKESMLRHQYTGAGSLKRNVPTRSSSRFSWRRGAVDSTMQSLCQNDQFYLNTSVEASATTVKRSPASILLSPAGDSNRWSPAVMDDDDGRRLLPHVELLPRVRKFKLEPITDIRRPESSSTILACSNSTRPGKCSSESVRYWDRQQSMLLHSGSGRNFIATLASLLTLGLPSAVVSILSLLLFFHIANNDSSANSAFPSIIKETAPGRQFSKSTYTLESFGIVSEEVINNLAMALCLISLSGSLCALFMSFLECYLLLKAAQRFASFEANDLYSNIVKFRRQSVYFRFFSHSGFFISVPLLILAMIVYLQTLFGHTFTSSSTVTGTVTTVVLATALLLVLVCLCFAVYSISCGHLQPGSDRNATKTFPTVENNKTEKSANSKNLSTLV